MKKRFSAFLMIAACIISGCDNGQTPKPAPTNSSPSTTAPSNATPAETTPAKGDSSSDASSDKPKETTSVTPEGESQFVTVSLAVPHMH